MHRILLLQRGGKKRERGKPLPVFCFARYPSFSPPSLFLWLLLLYTFLSPYHPRFPQTDSLFFQPLFLNKTLLLFGADEQVRNVIHISSKLQSLLSFQSSTLFSLSFIEQCTVVRFLFVLLSNRDNISSAQTNIHNRDGEEEKEDSFFYWHWCACLMSSSLPCFLPITWTILE